MTDETISIIDVHEIWPDSPETAVLLLANVDSSKRFTVWAMRKLDNSTLFSRKYFNDEAEARRSFLLLSEVLVEMLDTAYNILSSTPSKDPQ